MTQYIAKIKPITKYSVKVVLLHPKTKVFIDEFIARRVVKHKIDPEWDIIGRYVSISRSSQGRLFTYKGMNYICKDKSM